MTQQQCQCPHPEAHAATRTRHCLNMAAYPVPTIDLGQLWMCIDCVNSSAAPHQQTISLMLAGALEGLDNHGSYYRKHYLTTDRCNCANCNLEIGSLARQGYTRRTLTAALNDAEQIADFLNEFDDSNTVNVSIFDIEQELYKAEGRRDHIREARNVEIDAEKARKGQPIPCYAESYRSSRAYGGGEEGGWYYTAYSLQNSSPTECECDPAYIMSYYHDREYDEWIGPTIAKRASEHDSKCPAGRLLATLEHAETTAGPARQEFTDEFITAGGTWNMDSGEDAPPEYAGEIATRASRADYFALSLTKHGQEAPRPHYQ